MSATQQPPKIPCPHCQALIKAPALAAGSLVNCPKCGQSFRLGEPEGGGGRELGAGSRGSGVEGQRRDQAQRPSAKDQQPAVAKPPTVRGVSQSQPGQPPSAPVRRPVAQPAVPSDFTSAAATTQPAHRPPAAAEPQPANAAPPSAPNWQADTESLFPAVPPPRRGTPDNLVDPNLLPPPPPKVKPKATTLSVTCYLCGTKMDVPLDQIGQTVKCPDCHAVNEVAAPKKKEPAETPKGPTLEGATEFGLSEAVERPAYRPLQAPRGEYSILATLQRPDAPPGWSAPSSDSPGAAEAAAAEEEFRVADPVERLEIKHEIRLPEPDPEEAMYDGKYDDEISGAGVDPDAPEAWKKAPFLFGLVGFLFYTSTLPRWIMYSVGATAILTVGHTAVVALANPAPEQQFLAIVMAGTFSVTFGLWLAPFTACLLAIVEDTANGHDQVEGWPDWSVGDWIFNSLYVPVAAFITGLPGIFLASMLISN